MKKQRGVSKIAALLWAASLLTCLALSACGDATPTTAVGTTPPLQAVPPLTPFSPVAFSRITTTAITPIVTTAIPTTALSTTTLAPTTAPVNSIYNDWLRGVPCKAPCWENITPGKTTPHDAIEILKNNPEFKIPEYRSTGPTDYNLHGTDSDTGEPAVIWNLLAFHSKPEPAHIEIINPETQPYRLKEAFSTYGEPSHVIAVYGFQEGTQPQPYAVYLIYMSQGLILANTTKGEEPTLTPETVFTGVYFFIPGQQGFNLVDGQADIRGDVMVEWQGYKDFKFYCRAGDASKGIRKCT